MNIFIGLRREKKSQQQGQKHEKKNPVKIYDVETVENKVQRFI